jgi:hypothetical protein
MRHIHARSSHCCHPYASMKLASRQANHRWDGTGESATLEHSISAHKQQGAQVKKPFVLVFQLETACPPASAGSWPQLPCPRCAARALCPGRKAADPGAVLCRQRTASHSWKQVVSGDTPCSRPSRLESHSCLQKRGGGFYLDVPSSRRSRGTAPSSEIAPGVKHSLASPDKELSNVIISLARRPRRLS